MADLSDFSRLWDIGAGPGTIRAGAYYLECENPVKEVVKSIGIISCSRRGTDWPLTRTPLTGSRQHL